MHRYYNLQSEFIFIQASAATVKPISLTKIKSLNKLTFNYVLLKKSGMKENQAVAVVILKDYR